MGDYELIQYTKTDNILTDAKNIIDSAKSYAIKSVNWTLVQRNWLLGERIALEELKGENRAEYGKKVIKKLSKQLTEIYGSGFTKTNLYNFYNFYKTYADIFHTVCGKSLIMYLDWSHFRILLQEENKDARDWYAQESVNESWSVRTLQRNISSQYYYRMLKSPKKDLVRAEMKQLTADYQTQKEEFVKDPVILEFLGFRENETLLESTLENSLISNLQKFLMELGKGYAFVGRQMHIHTEKKDYYIDLVFYNFILKCFVLIDLETETITHQDVGQMDMYVRMFDELKRSEGDNPTLGILLCADTDADIAKYSVLKGNEQLFATKYKFCLPTEEQLRKEIESQKNQYYLAHPKKEEATK
ncbi:PDDEXK nuclease domain-containing protein [uncultured Treponema sp.]|uniref:PDDEXK nuclease domain-containing protein n=1 Tax=uncultured Treponema sp. TaxID=162155 RepID=UPI002598415C|nr:PDDEXK nuclease domain-containing protein [uncultured Treponema sp.]